ncbi:MAG: NAD-dependent epimerase/dehydratase family protein [Phycisphaerae bacterium]|nr:NAD-dependent epimerase/dehydratase family protein [Phycisphaerae bacterium]
MKALVTGGGGFVGFALCERLRSLDWEVRSLSRGDYPGLAKIGVDHVRSDLCDRKATLAAVRGCDAVFHVAAKAGVWGPYREYHQANVVATESVIEACRAAGVARLVFTSSPSVVFDGRGMEGVDESVPYSSHPHSHYSATKALAEQAALAANDANLRTCALRPHLVWGPRDNHIFPRLVARAKAGRLRIVGDGGNRVDVTYIDNAVEAHVLAEESLRNAASPVGGRAYFVSDGAPVNAWQFINQLLACADMPPITRRVPLWAASAIGGVLETTYGLLGIRAEPPMTRFVARELATSHWFDIGAARRDLGYRAVVDQATGLAQLRAFWLGSAST